MLHKGKLKLRSGEFRGLAYGYGQQLFLIHSPTLINADFVEWVFCTRGLKRNE